MGLSSNPVSHPIPLIPFDPLSNFTNPVRAEWDEPNQPSDSPRVPHALWSEPSHAVFARPRESSAAAASLSPRGRFLSSLHFFQRAATSALDAFDSGLIHNVLERLHALPRTDDPAVQIAGNFAPVGEPRARGARPKGILKAQASLLARTPSKALVSINLQDNEISLDRSGRLGGSSPRAVKKQLKQQPSLTGGLDASRRRSVEEVLRETGADIIGLQKVRAEEERWMRPVGAGGRAGDAVRVRGELGAYQVRFTAGGELETVGRYDFDGQLM